jgi:rubrerythrin
MPEETLQEFTQRWWRDLLQDEVQLMRWLNRLYHNEKEADQRFVNFAAKFCQQDEESRKVFMVIANQEAAHARLVQSVMLNRGWTTWSEPAGPERYWNTTRHLADDIKTAAAVGAYAEVTSLNRLRVLATDEQTPADLKEMFAAILPDEEYHAKALADLAGPDKMALVRPYHEAGLRNLGLHR